MRKSKFVLAAALALPIPPPALSQAPAGIALDQLQPVSGSWSYRPIAGGSEAAFRDSAASQRLLIRCSRAARIVSIVRTLVPAAAPTLSVWTSSIARNLPSRFEATRMLTSSVSARDPLLDSIAFSRGRFGTSAAGAPLLIVPTSPEVARVVEDCRT